MNDVEDQTQEERWLDHGGGLTTMESPPPLHTCRHKPGKPTYQALLALLDHIEAGGLYAKQIRATLASCQAGTDRVVTPGAALFGLPSDLLDHVLLVFAWIRNTGGVDLDDFGDKGECFLRLVLGMSPKAIASLKKGDA